MQDPNKVPKIYVQKLDETTGVTLDEHIKNKKQIRKTVKNLVSYIIYLITHTINIRMKRLLILLLLQQKTKKIEMHTSVHIILNDTTSSRTKYPTYIT